MICLYESHYYTINGVCPCKIADHAVEKALLLFKKANDVKSFVETMELNRVIGKRIWYDEAENTIFISKKYACESGGGCKENKTIIGERCHCDHYNHSKEFYPKYYCKCGAEFYRPMFVPLFGKGVLIEPFQTVLSGDEECVLAIRIEEVEQNDT